MRYTQNALNVMASLTYKGIGKGWVAKNLTGQEPVEELVALLNVALKTEQASVQDFQHRKNRLLAQLEKVSDYMDGVIALGDEGFPKHRGLVKPSERPVVLFYKGDISLLDVNQTNIAVIGVLSPDQATQREESVLVSELVKEEVTIVSGLAMGCDSIAHEQTLAMLGNTVAILPSPLHNILPASNKGLAAQIMQKGGLVVTEYLNDASSKMAFTGRYQERDRLQALFSDGIILISSYAKNDLGNDSGSRLAMEYAKKYGIPRAVMYNALTDSNNPKYDLNRQIMRESNDVIVINPTDMVLPIRKLLNTVAKVEPVVIQDQLF